jgi:hypothetical protein
LRFDEVFELQGEEIIDVHLDFLDFVTKLLDFPLTFNQIVQNLDEISISLIKFN